jgi:hypothetical protein
VGPRAGLDNVERRKFLTLSGIDPLVVQPVAVPLLENKRIDYKIIPAESA